MIRAYANGLRQRIDPALPVTVMFMGAIGGIRPSPRFGYRSARSPISQRQERRRALKL